MNKINRISSLVIQNHGVDISKYNDTYLKKSIERRITETSSNSEREYYDLLRNNLVESNIFLSSLQNNHSEFFRNAFTFSVLEHIIFPSIIVKNANRKHNGIRVWSAACAAGQEAYSLAMILEELKDPKGDKVDYRIFATDEIEDQIIRALEGKFIEYSLNNVNLRQLKKWFNKYSDTYIIKSELKDKIEFSVFDLLTKHFSSPQTSIFGEFDIVFLANILFYYKPDYQKKILEKAGNCLAAEGFICTGEAERSILIEHNFIEVIPHSGIFKKKVE